MKYFVVLFFLLTFVICLHSVATEVEQMHQQMYSPSIPKESLAVCDTVRLFSIGFFLLLLLDNYPSINTASPAIGA